MSNIKVKIGRMPGMIREYDLPEGSTVEDALAEAGLSSEGYDVRINGETARSGAELEDGQSVLLVRQIKGNVFVRFVRFVRFLLRS